MIRKILQALIFSIIGLAALGLMFQLFTNTWDFLLRILLMLGFGVAFFAVIYFIFFRNRTSSNEMKKYRQAVKQSNKKYKQNNNIRVTPSMKTNVPIPSKVQTKKRKKRPTHLRVIDGNKKRKKRASN